MIKISRIKVMKLVCGLFGLENLHGGDITSYIDISKMAEDLGFDSVSVPITTWSVTLTESNPKSSAILEISI